MSEFLTNVTVVIYVLVCIINVSAWTALIISVEKKENIDAVRKEVNLHRYSDWQIIAIGYMAAVTPYANMAFLHFSVETLKEVIAIWRLKDRIRKMKE